jgi:SAM-dependent methyltransferase
MDFRNAYEDAQFADAYSRLQFPGTYYLAYRDLAQIIFDHVTGRRALDFGCGAGRSTRFLRQHGFDVVGLDISGDMIAKARAIDPEGDYRLIPNGDFSQVGDCAFDLVLSAFTFDNIPTMSTKISLFRGLGRLLTREGRIVNLVSSPEIYTHEWASFSTADFPENKQARSGDIVRIINTAIDDRRPVEDILWTDESYRAVFDCAGLTVVSTYKPLAREDDQYSWVNETRIAPWVIYVLKKAEA